MKRLFQATALLFSACVSSFANAHFVWVIQNGDQVQVHFSESAESSEPELLKNVATAKLRALVPGNRGGSSIVEVPLTLTDTSLTGKADPKASVIMLAHEYGVVNKGDGSFLLKYLAKQHVTPLPGKWSAVDNTEYLPLEITPAWQGHTLVLSVRWQGQPAVNTEVKVAGCNLDATLTTDEKGIVRCEPKSSGVLSIRAKVVDQISGELDGKKYDSVRTYSTLTLPIAVPTLETVAHSLPALPKGITSFGAAIAGDTLYVYGGHFGEAHHYSDAGQSNEFRRISLTDKDAEWELLKGGPKLTGLAMVEFQGKLYRAGGFTAKNSESEDQSLWSQDSFASYDPATGQWTDLPALPAGRSSHDAAVMDGKLYVAGGWNMEGADKTTWHTTALVCDLTQPELKWTQLPAPPFQRRAVSLAACQAKLYVVGGMAESGAPTTEVAIYDPASQAWSTGPALHGTGMEGFGTSAFAACNKLIVTTMSGSVQMLSDDGSEWVLSGQANEPRFFHRQLTTADNRVLVVGGASMETGKTNTLELMQFVAR